MASIVDLIYFVVTVVVFGGAIAGILFVANRISEFTNTTKERLKTKGYHISDHGVQVQTQKRFNHEDYVDATQRGLLKAMGASSFGQVNSNTASSSSDKLIPEPSVKKSRSALLRRKSDIK